MGLRGPGARPKGKGAKGEPPKRRRLPWRKKGLSRLERVVAFLQWLPITKGRLAGKKMRLTDDQKEFLSAIYGGADDVRIAILSEPRGNGKTGLTAGLALCHLLGPESEQRGEVYCASVDRTMSGKFYNELEAIIQEVPEFDERVTCRRFHKQIEILDGDGKGSVFEALSGDAKKGHGLAPSLWIFDELAQVPDPELLDNLETGMGKRDRSLGLILSTQAEGDDHRLSQLIDDGLSGTDPGVVVRLLAAPEDADIFDPEVLRSVNPGIAAGYLSEKDLLADLEKARRLPAYEPRYRNRRLNQRVDANAEERILPPGVWKENSAPVDLEPLEGRPCYGGLDLSGKHDLTALVLVFPDDADEPTYDVLPIFWTPEGQLSSRKQSETNLFKSWISSGHLQAVPGPTIRMGWVAAELERLAQRYDIRGIAFDRWRIDDLKQDLADIGCKLPMQPRGQGYKDAGPDIEVMGELAMTGRLRHGGHPVLTACMANAIVTPDPAGNLKCDKEKSNGKASIRIDGAVSLAMACGLASRTPPPRESVYRSRGVLTVDLAS